MGTKNTIIIIYQPFIQGSFQLLISGLEGGPSTYIHFCSFPFLHSLTGGVPITEFEVPPNQGQGFCTPYKPSELCCGEENAHAVFSQIRMVRQMSEEDQQNNSGCTLGNAELWLESTLVMVFTPEAPPPIRTPEVFQHGSG